MKLNKLLLLILFLLFAVSHVFAQATVEKATAEVIKEEIKNKPYRIDARPFLEKSENMLRAITKGKPAYLQNIAKLKKADTYSVNDTTEFWAYNRLIENFNDSFYKVQSTCRAVGSNCYVFVEDSLWNVRISQTQVDAIVNGFDNSTPANASKGVYQTDTETFGNPPNIDGDDKVIILVLNIIDSFDPAAGNYSYVGGYFHSMNQYLNSDLVSVGYPAASNEAEMFYVDANPADMLSEAGLTEALSTVAHEFQHMIHFNVSDTYDVLEDKFINEGCSEMASFICGYGFRSQSDYSSATNGALLTWNSTIADYSRAARFMLYLYEQQPEGFLKKLVQEPLTGTYGLDAAITSAGGVGDHQEIIHNFHIANAINNKSVNPAYGFDLSTITPVNFTELYSPNQSGTINVDRFGAAYLNFKSGKNLTANISLNPGEESSKAAYIKADVIKVGQSVEVLRDVAIGSDLEYPGFGVDYDEMIFIVRNEIGSSFDSTDIDIDCIATGEAESSILELAYDENPALGAFGFETGDIVMVHFDKVADASLDSIKISAREQGSMTVKINEFTGSGTTIGFGSEYFSGGVTSQSNPTTVGANLSDNWVKVDLTTEDISAAKNFAIQVPYTDGNARVMVTSKEGTSSFKNFTYVKAQEKWLYYTKDDSNIWLYKIRAYVSFTTGTGDREVVELTPASFKLEQNYPNPFNPSTTINYTIPEAANVKLEIFDIKGEKIAELVNDFQNAGDYHATWNGKSFSGAKAASGIYFYRVTAGNVVESKKMMLLK